MVWLTNHNQGKLLLLLGLVAVNFIHYFPLDFAVVAAAAAVAVAVIVVVAAGFVNHFPLDCSFNS